jgi:hypothetical protein
MDPTDIERVIRSYYEQLYGHIFDNLDKWLKYCTHIIFYMIEPQR